MKTNFLKTFGIIVILFFLSNIAMYAQYDTRDRHPYDHQNNGGPNPPPGGDDPAPAPINEYLPILALIGAGLAYFAIKNRKKNNWLNCM